MAPLTRKELQPELLQELAQAALVCQTPHTPEELALLAEVFAEDLEGENLESVRRAFVLHRRRSPRFPTPAHIIALLPECRVTHRLAAIPPATSGRRTKGIGKLVCEALKGDRAAREAMDKLAAEICGKSGA